MEMSKYPVRIQFKKLMAMEEIAKQVMDKYPLSKEEKRGCRLEKAMRDNMRFEFAKKLYKNPEI